MPRHQQPLRPLSSCVPALQPSSPPALQHSYCQQESPSLSALSMRSAWSMAQREGKLLGREEKERPFQKERGA